jgi:uncharacterized membrane protein YkoI
MNLKWLGFVLLALLVTTACRNGNSSNDSDDTSVTLAQAQTIASNLYPGASALTTEIISRDNRQVWDVELDNGIAVYVDVQTGEVIETERIDDSGNGNGSGDGGSDGSDSGDGSMISSAEASNIALARFPDLQVIDTWLGSENGRPVWYVDMSNGSELYIDAITGEILEVDLSG